MPPSTPGKKKISAKRYASPGGLTTPANWNNTYPVVNIDDLNMIQDIDMSMDASSASLPNNNTSGYLDSPYSTYNSATNNNADNDVKPIDLSLYKEKLLKKMSMSASLNSSINTQSLPLLPSNQVPGKKRESLRAK